MPEKYGAILVDLVSGVDIEDAVERIRRVIAYVPEDSREASFVVLGIADDELAGGIEILCRGVLNDVSKELRRVYVDIPVVPEILNGGKWEDLPVLEWVFVTPKVGALNDAIHSVPVTAHDDGRKGRFAFARLTFAQIGRERSL
jgi:hypothetical protein